MTPDLHLKSSDTEAAAQTQPSIVNRDMSAVPSAHYNICVASVYTNGCIGGAAGLCGRSAPPPAPGYKNRGTLSLRMKNQCQLSAGYFSLP